MGCIIKFPDTDICVLFAACLFWISLQFSASLLDVFWSILSFNISMRKKGLKNRGLM